MGPMARYLGLILATDGQLDQAIDALREAVDRADTSRTPPWATLARNDLARVLDHRGTARDRAEAREVQSAADREAVRMGMGDLASRCRR
jgi:ATP/maltotriose-dependent transcriptional regulator MalT